MKINEMLFYHKATTHLCSSLNFEVVLDSCFGFFKEYFDLDGIYFNIFVPETKMIENIASVSNSGVNLSGRSIPLSEKQIQFIGQSTIGDINIVKKAHNNPMSLLINRELGEVNNSFMTVLLGIETLRLGVLGFYAKGDGVFSDDQARLIRLIQDPLTIAFSNTLRYREILKLKSLLEDDNQYLARELHKHAGTEIVGSEFGLSQVMESVRQVAPLNNHVLILGETGVGKEIIANAIHSSSGRAENPFIKVNCGAIPDTLIDSELFGHEKGAFTGAVYQKRGRFERADKGTIFLDEIGELPAPAQKRLLSVLQTKEIERVGGTETLKVDARVIAATNRNLEAMIKSGEFREDLWYRLNVYPILVPPLRKRTSDIPALVNYFIEKKAKEINLPYYPVPEMKEMEKLQEYSWPGNVRELENVVERALINCLADRQNPKLVFFPSSVTISEQPMPPNNGGVPSQSLDDVIKNHIVNVLQLTNGRIQGKNGAAAFMKINPSTLRNKMNKLGIPYGRKSTNFNKVSQQSQTGQD